MTMDTLHVTRLRARYRIPGGDPAVRARLDAVAQERSPFQGGTGLPRGAHWVRPELLCEVSFGEWTRDGKIRHSVFHGLRDDKKVEDVVKEKAAPVAGAESKVTFTNRYGIVLAADIYQPRNAKGRLPAIAVGGPFGAVKEQSSGLHAQTLAERGFVTVAFDGSYTGESSGQPRNVASPDIRAYL